MTLPNIGEIEHVEVDGLKIRVCHCGRADGLPIVMLSPWPESIYAFRDVIPSVKGLGSLLAVDLPGFGGSAGGVNIMSPTAQADFVIKLAGQFGVARMHAIGPDVGTPALLFAAAQKPDLFESIVCGSGATDVDQAGPVLRDMINSPVGYFAGTEGGEFVVSTLKALAGDLAPEAVIEDYRAAASGQRLETQVNFVRAYRSQLPELKAKLESIETPVLIISGEKDPLVPPANGRLLADHLRHNRYTLIEAGHFVWEEKPGEYGAAIRDWILGGYRKV
jgi:pimeloyl-ACP methyl ester carboxylesterase